MFGGVVVEDCLHKLVSAVAYGAGVQEVFVNKKRQHFFTKTGKIVATDFLPSYPSICTVNLLISDD